MKNLKAKLGFKQLIKSTRGDAFIETIVTVLISVVLGGLLLALLYALMKDTVFPSLSQKITEMFSYKQ